MFIFRSICSRIALSVYFVHDVRWVVCTQDLDKFNDSGSYLGLRPKICHVQVASLAWASAPAHTKCCTRIAMESNLVLETKIPSDRLQTDCLDNSNVNPMQFRLS